MLLEFLKANVGENAAPFVGVGLFVVVVGVSLWLTPRLARWIDERRGRSDGFYDGMMDRAPEGADDKK